MFLEVGVEGASEEVRGKKGNIGVIVRGIYVVSAR